jgi:hypothetical protein
MISRIILETLAARSRANLAHKIPRGYPGYLTADASKLPKVHVDACQDGYNLSQYSNVSWNERKSRTLSEAVKSPEALRRI